MEKTKLEICVGTTCYILGASELQHIERFLPEELAPLVEISGVSCIGACKNSNYGSAPFVRINGKIIGNASVHSVVEELIKITKGA